MDIMQREGNDKNKKERSSCRSDGKIITVYNYYYYICIVMGPVSARRTIYNIIYTPYV